MTWTPAGPVSFHLGGYRGGSAVQLGSLSGSTRQLRKDHVPAFTLAEARLIEPERDLRIRKIQGDGRCMFRALVGSPALNEGARECFAVLDLANIGGPIQLLLPL
jgi:hypothetical protein